MSVKFIYRRYVTQATKQDKERGLPMSISCRGGACVGYKWDKDNQRVVLAVARCSPEDNFNKRVARDIVIGRLASKKPNRNHTMDLLGLKDLTPQKVEDLVWGWLENKERLWDAQPVSHSVH